MIVAADEEEEYTSGDEVALRRSSRLRRGTQRRELHSSDMEDNSEYNSGFRAFLALKLMELWLVIIL